MSYPAISRARAKGEHAAENLLMRLRIVAAPVPIKEIAVAEGCNVKATVLADDLSGMAFVKDGQKFIVYNATHHPNRQRFTIAHELAHHVLHAKMLSASVHVDKGVLRRDSLSSGGTDEIEISANAFAACILMPVKLIRAEFPRSIDLENDEVVRRLAQKFGVSTVALTNRILNLSLS